MMEEEIIMATHAICLVGMPAVGKSTVARSIKEHLGFNWIQTRNIVAKLKAENPSLSLQDKGLTLSQGSGAEAFCQELFKTLEADSYNVIDAIRPIEHWRRIQERYREQAHLIAVTAPRSVREQRFAQRHQGDSIRLRDSHEVEREIPILLEEACYTLNSTDALELRIALMVSFILHLPSPLRLLLTLHQRGLDVGTIVQDARAIEFKGSINSLLREV